MNVFTRFATLMTVVILAGCQTVKPYDYSNFRAHPPRSILVLPPLNESTAIEGTYGYLTTVTRPVAERGYYVFPVAVVDQFMKANGLPGAAEMQQAPLAKFAEVTGADAVMFLDLKQYGAQYKVLSSVVTVEVNAKLVDTRTGTLLWEGHGVAQQSSSGSGSLLVDLVAAAVTQALNKHGDKAHQVSRLANANLFYPEQTGLPYGPYSDKYEKSH
ncbi:MAG: DUF799 family lipoprotein [Proteobacteria bacterium]|nr:DUF799 family lipoprotein [Pseudomonadota bacterium]